ncbi:MAG TPA: response regulator transcription factor [Gaiellaceae bacterium]|nr:response regulator transcription factor [Gaiellaceae bacterium]
MRLVIADDSAVVRDGLFHALETHGHDVVGTARDAVELLACVQRERPHVALVDIRMPPTHTSEGLDAASAIRKRAPDVALLVLSQYIDADYALTLLRESPARSGYLLKDRITELTTLLEAIERVAQGETVVDPELVELLLHRPATESRLAELSERERTVLALLAEGLSDRAIAARLWLTQKTVETHVRHILAKLALPPDADHNRRVLAVLTFLRNQG